MAPRRLNPIEDAVHLQVDGKSIPARAGEPVAVALAAAGRLVFGRSVKYHRPRGPACFGGRCDGCLMRVDGVQSVMTCRLPARDGMVVETQNVVGSARRDLLAATDWFFPGGMNHHEMFTWNEQVNKVMQKVARRIAGIGELPEAVAEPRESRDAEVDVLVIGGGPAGLRVATRCAEAGLSVTLVDEEPIAGGSLRWWPGDVTFEAARHRCADVAERLVGAAYDAGVLAMPRTSAVGAYDPWEDVAGAPGDPPIRAPERRSEPPVVIADSPEHLTRFRPRRVIVASGRHEGASAFGGNDRPGVMTLSAAGRLLAHGVVPGERVLLAGADPGLEALAESLKQAGATVLGPFAERTLRRAEGRPEVDGCVLEVDGDEREERCDAVVIAPETSAVYELAAQLGVTTEWSGTGFELGVHDAGATDAPDVRVTGWAAGVHGLEAALAHADAVAAAIVGEVR